MPELGRMRLEDLALMDLLRVEPLTGGCPLSMEEERVVFSFGRGLVEAPPAAAGALGASDLGPLFGKVVLSVLEFEPMPNLVAEAALSTTSLGLLVPVELVAVPLLPAPPLGLLVAGD